MRSRKMLCLLVALAAMGALAAPAMAQAEGPFWYVNGEKLEGEEQLELDGTLEFSRPLSESFTFVMAKCEVSLGGTIENGEEAAEGEIYNFVLNTHPCSTNLPGCTSLVLPNLPWSIAANETGVDLSEVAFTVSFDNVCSEAYGIPKKRSVSGTLQGQWNNEGSCLEYVNAGSLVLTGTEEPVLSDGGLCPWPPSGNITLE